MAPSGRSIEDTFFDRRNLARISDRNISIFSESSGLICSHILLARVISTTKETSLASILSSQPSKEKIRSNPNPNPDLKKKHGYIPLQQPLNLTKFPPTNPDPPPLKLNILTHKSKLLLRRRPLRSQTRIPLQKAMDFLQNRIAIR